jgi:hypothetical protein
MPMWSAISARIRGATMRARFVGLSVAVLACLGWSIRSARGTSRTTCPLPAPLVVTLDSIGPLPLHARFGELRSLCATAFVDTGLALPASEHAGSWLALSFPFANGRVFARPRPFYPIVDTLSPGMWVVSGSNVALPNGIALDAPWRTLATAYGPGVIQLSPPMAKVRFCRLPGWWFIYHQGVTLGPSETEDVQTAMHRLAPEARVSELQINFFVAARPHECKSAS